jgi:uncharacterized protein
MLLKMIIDSHVNITHNGKWFNTSYDASLERLLAEMAEAQIDKCLLIAMPEATTNKYVASIVEKHPQLFRGLGFLDFKSNIKKQVNNIVSMGLSGIKIHPRLQNINICDPFLDFFWEYIDGRKLTILVDGYFQLLNNTFTISDILPFAFEKHLKKHHNVTFILAHAGCHKVMDTYFLCRSYQNFYTDLSYSINFFKGTSFYSDYNFLLKNADRKVLFGSDFPEIRLIDAKKSFQALYRGLSSEKIENISSSNAMRLFSF